ncbi:unnamed protein product, partial [Durusdinium trenchii]
ALKRIASHSQDRKIEELSRKDLAFERREVHQRSHEADAELSLLRRKAHEKDQACTAHDVGVPRSVGAGDVGDV